jgi:hypothetical protein
MRQGRIATVAVAFALVGTLLSGTVGAAAAVKDQKPLTKQQFVKQANRICHDANSQRDQLFASYVAKLNGRLPDAATLATAVNEYQPILQQQIDSLGALQPPKALQRRYEALLGATRSALATVVANPSAVVALVTGGNSPFDDLFRRARTLGLRECAG